MRPFTRNLTRGTRTKDINNLFLLRQEPCGQAVKARLFRRALRSEIGCSCIRHGMGLPLSAMWKAAVLMFVAMSFIPAGDSAGKLLSSVHGVHPVFVAASRFLIGALIVLPFMPPSGWAVFRDWRIWLRGFMLTGGIVSIQVALKSAPLADVFAAFFIGPAVSTLLAVVLLREPLDLRRTCLLALGFAGVLLVVRPGFGAATGLEFAVLAGTFYGAYLTASRWLGAVAAPQALLFSQLAVSALVTVPLALPHIPQMTLPVIGLTLVSAICSMLGNALLILAYRIELASHLAPFVYFQLVAAAVLGGTIFGDLPDRATWVGLVIILASGITSALLAARAPIAARPDRA